MAEMNMEFSEFPVERALGVTWDVKSDRFGFKIQTRVKPHTKRGLLSIISSVYDPFGIVSPFVLKGKLILQEITRLKLGWDEQITDDHKKLWANWLSELPSIKAASIPRCLKPSYMGEILDVQLHLFCDASTHAYGAVSYMRLVDDKNQVCCMFLMGKARLTPIKPITIPRLELSAAVLAVKLQNLIIKEIDLTVHKTVYWTDSTTVLRYINNYNQRYHTFVANRLALIESGSNPEQWKYVPTALNPADDASRGLNGGAIHPGCRWLTGPPFLREVEGKWPEQIISANDNMPSDDPEIKNSVNVFVTSKPDSLVQLTERFSSWNRLRKAVSWFIRFKRYLRARGQLCFRSSVITSTEMENAGKDVIRYVQINLLETAFINPSNISHLPKSVRKLNPFVSEDGLFRVGGRLSNSPFDFDTKHPVILPKCHISELIIRHVHDNNGHVGSAHTWSILRENFWILNRSMQVRKSIGKCLYCSRRNAKVSEQIMADLPTARVTPSRPPFCSTGVDYFVPLLVKQGRSVVKRFGCLFTCMSCRAVHLEIADDLSASSFINAFRRFVCRRGKPEEMFSDNGTNFIGAEREMREELNKWNKTRIASYMAEKGIRWRFNPPRSPHTGGVWERLVRLVKTVLRSLLCDQLVHFYTLHTVLVEAEGIINSRPLVPASFDPSGDEPLTPNHLLLFRPSGTIPQGLFDKSDNYSRRRWRQVQYLAQKFWNRWRREYLPLLQSRPKWLSKCENLKVDDIVLMSDDDMPRGRWPVARVMETFPDKHENVRQVKVKTCSGMFVRSVAKLCKLDVHRDSVG